MRDEYSITLAHDGYKHELIHPDGVYHHDAIDGVEVKIGTTKDGALVLVKAGSFITEKSADSIKSVMMMMLMNCGVLPSKWIDKIHNKESEFDGYYSSF